MKLSEKNKLMNSINVELVLILSLIFSILIIISPFLNNEIYARTEQLIDTAEKTTDGSDLDPYYVQYTKMMEEEIINFKNLDWRGDILPKNNDPKNEIISKPKKTEIKKFIKNLGYYSKDAADTLRGIANRRTQTYWQMYKNSPGIMCASRHVLLLFTRQQSMGILEGRLNKEVTEDIIETLDKMDPYEVNGDEEMVIYDSDKKRNVNGKYDPTKQLPASSLNLLFAGYKKDGKLVENREELNKLWEKLGIKFKLEADGQIYLSPDEFEKLKTELAKDDKFKGITLMYALTKDGKVPDSYDDYAKYENPPDEHGITTELYVPKEYKEGIADQETLKTYKAIDGIVQKIKAGDSNGFVPSDHISIPTGNEGLLKTYDIVGGAVYRLAYLRTNPVLNYEALKSAESDEEYKTHNPNIQYGTNRLFDNEKLNGRDYGVSPQGAFVVAYGNLQYKKEEKNDVSGGTRNKSATPAFWLENPSSVLGASRHNTILWRTVEGKLGYLLTNEQYKSYIWGNAAMYQLPGPELTLFNDATTFQKAWRDFVKYIDDHKDSERSKFQRLEHIEYENNKYTKYSNIPFGIKNRTFKYSDLEAGQEIASLQKPFVNYFPYFTKDADEPKSANFRTDTQEWIIGPYTIEYFKKDNLKFNSQHLTDSKIMSDIVTANLMGRYIDFADGQGDSVRTGAGIYNPSNITDAKDKNGNIVQTKEQVLKSKKAMLDNMKTVSELKEFAGINQATVAYNDYARKLNEINTKIKSGEAISEHDLSLLQKDYEELVKKLSRPLPDSVSDKEEEKNKKLEELKKNHESLIKSYVNEKGKKLTVPTNTKDKKDWYKKEKLKDKEFEYEKTDDYGNKSIDHYTIEQVLNNYENYVLELQKIFDKSLKAYFKPEKLKETNNVTMYNSYIEYQGYVARKINFTLDAIKSVRNNLEVGDQIGKERLNELNSREIELEDLIKKFYSEKIFVQEIFSTVDSDGISKYLVDGPETNYEKAEKNTKQKYLSELIFRYNKFLKAIKDYEEVDVRETMSPEQYEAYSRRMDEVENHESRKYVYGANSPNNEFDENYETHRKYEEEEAKKEGRTARDFLEFGRQRWEKEHEMEKHPIDQRDITEKKLLKEISSEIEKGVKYENSVKDMFKESVDIFKEDGHTENGGTEGSKYFLHNDLMLISADNDIYEKAYNVSSGNLDVISKASNKLNLYQTRPGLLKPNKEVLDAAEALFNELDNIDSDMYNKYDYSNDINREFVQETRALVGLLGNIYGYRPDRMEIHARRQAAYLNLQKLANNVEKAKKINEIGLRGATGRKNYYCPVWTYACYCGEDGCSICDTERECSEATEEVEYRTNYDNYIVAKQKSIEEQIKKIKETIEQIDTSGKDWINVPGQDGADTSVKGTNNSDMLLNNKKYENRIKETEILVEYDKQKANNQKIDEYNDKIEKNNIKIKDALTLVKNCYWDRRKKEEICDGLKQKDPALARTLEKENKDINEKIADLMAKNIELQKIMEEKLVEREKTTTKLDQHRNKESEEYENSVKNRVNSIDDANRKSDEVIEKNGKFKEKELVDKVEHFISENRKISDSISEEMEFLEKELKYLEDKKNQEVNMPDTDSKARIKKYEEDLANFEQNKIIPALDSIDQGAAEKAAQEIQQIESSIRNKRDTHYETYLEINEKDTKGEKERKQRINAATRERTPIVKSKYQAIEATMSQEFNNLKNILAEKIQLDYASIEDYRHERTAELQPKLQACNQKIQEIDTKLTSLIETARNELKTYNDSVYLEHFGVYEEILQLEKRIAWTLYLEQSSRLESKITTKNYLQLQKLNLEVEMQNYIRYKAKSREERIEKYEEELKKIKNRFNRRLDENINILEEQKNKINVEKNKVEEILVSDNIQDNKRELISTLDLLTNKMSDIQNNLREKNKYSKVITYEKKEISIKNNKFLSKLPSEPTEETAEEHKDRDTGIREIDNWKFLIIGTDGNVRKEVQDQPYLPNPGEKFYYVIKHDPRLVEITSASFDFAFTLYNGEFEYYTAKSVVFQNVTGDARINMQEKTNANGYKTVANATMTPFVKARVNSLNAQALVIPKAAIWTDFLKLTLEIGREGKIPDFDLDLITDSTPTPNTGTNKEPPTTDKIPLFELRLEEKNEQAMAKLYMPVGGEIWIDKKHGEKKLAFNHKHDENDEKPEEGSVEVEVNRVIAKIDKNTNHINEIVKKEEARLYIPKTFDEVKERIFVKDDGTWGPYEVHDLGFSEKEQKEYGIDNGNIGEYRVIFETVFKYDGLIYKPVLPLNMYDDGAAKKSVEQARKEYLAKPHEYKEYSKAVENTKDRDELNKNFAEIEGRKPYDNLGGNEIQDDEFKNHANNYKRDKIFKLDYEQKQVEDGNYYTSTLKPIKLNETDKDSTESEKARILTASTLNLDLPYPIYPNIHIPFDSLNKEKIGKLEKVDVPKEKEEPTINEIPWYDGTKIKFKGTEPYSKQINLGLYEREKVDLTATQDLVGALLFVNKKAQGYKFGDGMDFTDFGTPEDGNQGTPDQVELNETKLNERQLNINFKEKNHKNYILDLYKADFLYRTAMYSTPMTEEINMGAANFIGNKALGAAFDSYEEFAEAIYSSLETDMKEELKGEVKDNAKPEEKQGAVDDTRQLDIFLTYKISVANKSEFDNVYVTEIRNEYNKELLTEISTTIEKTIQKSDTTDTYKVNVQSDDSKVKIEQPKFRKAEIYDTTSMSYNGQGDDPGLTRWGLRDELKKEKQGLLAYPSKMTPDGKDKELHKKNGIFLKVGEKVDLYTTYRLNRTGTAENGQLPNAINALSNVDLSGLLGNMVEIGSFAVYNPITGKMEGKVDKDSAPGNHEIKIDQLKKLDEVKLEDDTGMAPIMNLRVKKDKQTEETTSRNLSGLVWEDSRNESAPLTGQNVNSKIMIANGKYEPEIGEKPLGNQKVVLEERISVKADSTLGQKLRDILQKSNINIEDNSYIDIPFVWPKEVNTGSGKINMLLDSAQKTDEDGKYFFKDIPVGNFVVKVPYTSHLYTSTEEVNSAARSGKPSINIEDLVRTADQGITAPPRTIKWINGVDFKSTYYRNNGDDANVNETWIPKVRKDNEENLSYIRDDEYRRLEVNKNLEDIDNNLSQALETMDELQPKDENNVRIVHQYGRMFSNTPKIAFTVENLEGINVAGSYILTDDKLEELKGMYLFNTSSGTSTTPDENERTIHYLKTREKVEDNSEELLEKYKELYNIKHINAGIVQRPIAKTMLNKDLINVTVETNNGTKIIDLKWKTSDKYSPPDTSKDSIYEKAGGTVEFQRTFNQDKSIGYENVTILDNILTTTNKDKPGYDDYSVSAQGLVYLNLDEGLMQGTKIKTKYEITVINLSEPDFIKEKAIEEKAEKLAKDYTKLINEKINAYFVGKMDDSTKLNHESNLAQYGYGTYLTESYYKPQANYRFDQIDYAEYKEIMDVISNNMNYDPNAFQGTTLQELTGDETNPTDIQTLKERSNWKYANKTDLINKLHNYRIENSNNMTPEEMKVAIEKMAKTAPDIVDEKGVKYIDGSRSNILISTNKINKVFPAAFAADINDPNYIYKEKSYIGAERYISALSDAKDLAFENTAEILVYDLASGKRFRGAVPGTVFTPMDFTKIERGNEIQEKFKKRGMSQLFLKSVFELDSSTTEKITLSPPTGLSSIDKSRTTRIIILSISAGIIAIIGISFKTKMRKEIQKNINS